VPVGDTGAVARTRGWRKGILEAENFPLEQVSDYLERDDCVVWADLTSPDLADLKLVADELGLSSSVPRWTTTRATCLSPSRPY
jgi:hypothetical protein